MSDQWTVGIKRENGVLGIISSNSHINPNNISTVFIPIRVSKEDAYRIYPTPLEKSGSHERSMGKEVCHTAVQQGENPDTGDFWEVQLDIWEYPPGAFNFSQLEVSGDVEIPDVDGDSLLQRIKSEF